MDTGQILTLITGSGGAMIVLVLWVKALIKQNDKLEQIILDKDKEIKDMSNKVIALSVDIQRSLNEQSGCKYPHDKE